MLLTILFAAALQSLGTIGLQPDGAPLVAESHSGAWAVVAHLGSNDARYALVDRRSGRELWEFPGGYSYSRYAFGGNGMKSMVAFSPNDERIAVGGTSLSEYDVRSRRLLWRHDNLRVNAVAYSPDGKLVAAGGALPIVAAYESGTGLERWHADRGSIVISIAVDPHSAIVASGSDGGGVRLWDVANGSELPHLRIAHLGSGPHQQAALDGFLAHEGGVLDVGFLQNGMLVSGAGDGSFRLWDPLRGRMLAERVCPDAVNSITVDTAGIIAGCFDSGPALFDPSTLGVREYFAQDNGGTVNVWPVPGGWLVLGADGTLKRWYASNFGIQTLSGTIRSAALSPGGDLVAYTYGDRIVHVASVRTRDDVAQIDGLTPAKYECCFSSAVTLLAMTRNAVLADSYVASGFVDHHGAYNGLLRVWNLRGRKVASYAGVTASEIAPIAGGAQVIVTAPSMFDTPWSASLIDLGSRAVSVWQPKQTVFGRLQGLDRFTSAAPIDDGGPALLTEIDAQGGRLLQERRLPSGRIARTFRHLFAPYVHGVVQDRQNCVIAVLGSQDGLTVLSLNGTVRARNPAALGDAQLAAWDARGGIAAFLAQPQTNRCDGNYHLHVLSEGTGREIASISRPVCAQNVQLSDDGRVLVVQTARGVDLWAVR